CESLCWYCACSVVITQDRDKAAAYVDTLLQEADLVAAALGEHDRRVVQHHWGGGTPTFLPPDECRRLFEGLCARFPLADGAEVSIEVDPRVTTDEHLEALAAVGFHRISMGVQDFDPKVQQAIHRVQSFQTTQHLVERSRELGFDSVNLDLVYGLPYQNPDGFAATLAQIAELRPDRIACYSYAHVPWLKKHQQLMPEDAMPTGADKQALFCQALAALVDDGMEPIGMDHFARSDDELCVAAHAGRLHRNFMGYTTRPADDMLSFGVTSIGEVDGAFTQNLKEVKTWREAIARGELPTQRGHRRSDDDERRRRVILDLMCRFALSFDDHGGRAAFEAAYRDALDKLRPMADDGLLVFDEGGLTVTDDGKLLVRNLAMAFDAYLPKQPGGDAPRFSRTV
ncbi:MAG: oxygen-independent coproporphyrinogen III oxidase, partial [Planctomycetes bacterium]|nr:oxygen-independent coproporphyrinogen III oxidase [Planctomycetota bacterium]